MALRVAARLAGGGTLLAGGALLSQGDDARRTVAYGLARVDDKLRPALAAVLPAQTFICLYSASRNPFIQLMSASVGADAVQPSAEATATRVRAMGLTFRNDLGNAAGLDKDGSLLDFNYALGAGFSVVGTVLSEPHTGNVFSFFGGIWEGNVWTPLPASGAALNSLGLPSKGVEAALANIAAFRERRGVSPQCAGSGAKADGAGDNAAFPIGVSIMGHPAHGDDPAKKLAGIVHCVRRAIPLADFLEINESCPNVHHGGGGASATRELRARLEAVVAARDELAKTSGRRVPILVKLGGRRWPTPAKPYQAPPSLAQPRRATTRLGRI